jgi:hypothetical protein
LQKCGLRLGRRSIDFIRKNQTREDRPAHEAEVSLPRLI